MQTDASLVQLAAPYLYEGETVLWAARQPRWRGMSGRLIAALPALVALVLGLRELARMIPVFGMPQREPGALLAALALCAISGAFLFHRLLRPLLHERELQALVAVLTNRRLVFIELERDAQEYVRRPLGPAVLGPGDVVRVTVSARRGGATIHLFHSRAIEGRVTRLEAERSGEALRELVGALSTTLEVPAFARDPAPRSRRLAS